MRFVNLILILIIKCYKYFLSPFLGPRCRYLPTCTDYFIDCIKLNGAYKGLILGTRRILRCHPIKFLGGSDGFDPAPNLNTKREEKKYGR